MGVWMWKRVTVCRSPLLKSVKADGPFFFIGLSRLAKPFFLALALSLFSSPAAAEQLIVKIILNQEEKGDFFVNRNEDGDFLVKVDDLKSIGLGSPSGTGPVIDGEQYLSLRSIKGIAYEFDEGTLSLAINAAPALFEKQIFDFFPLEAQKVYYPEDTSVFLNYGADYFAGEGFSFTSFNLANQLGARMGDFLFLTDTNYSKDRFQERFVRLQSSLTYDDRKEMRRLIAGDFFASSGDLGGTLNLGGVSLAKIYRIDPYFISYPTVGLTGQVATPSEAKIYLNGILMKTERFSPGEFVLQNIAPYGAAGAVDVVIKDSFGREQRIHHPYYFAGSSMLKRGLHEYSYNLGLIRDQFGTKSNRYSRLAFSGFHRYGVSDSLTLGIRGEARNELYNLGPQATFLLGSAGIAGVSLAGSAGRSSNTGAAGILSYIYQGVHAGAGFTLEGYTRDYANINTNSLDDRPKMRALGNLSYTDRVLGTLSVGCSSTGMYVGRSRDELNASYTRNLTVQSTITATYRRIREGGYDNQFFVSLNYTPKPGLSVSSAYQKARESNSEILELQKNPPIGEGIGYRATLRRSETYGQETYTINPSFQYNGRYGIYLAEFNGTSTEGRLDDQYHLSTSGSLVYVGNTFGVTRPVYDSFGLVNVGDLKGIKVFLNSQEIGVTDSSGKLFIPNLGSFYHNQVAIGDKEIPIDYYLSNVVKLVSPPLRSGSCIPFVAKKMQIISGTLKMKAGEETKPVEFQEITLGVNGRKITFPTGTGGIFDIDPSQSEEFKKMTETEESGCASAGERPSPFIKAGTYNGTFDYEGKPITFKLTIPESKEPSIDLGQIVVEVPPSSAGEHHTEEAPRGEVTVAGDSPARENSTDPPSQGEETVEMPPDPKTNGEGTVPSVKEAMPVSVQKEAESSPASSGELPEICLYFGFDKSEFSSIDDMAFIATIARIIQAVPKEKIIIEGHADRIGARRYNQSLGMRRALAVAHHLNNKNIDRWRIKEIRSFGESRPVCGSLLESCRRLNRRCVIRFTD